MEFDVYKEAIHSGANAFAYHEAVFDADGKMVDYVFLDVNSSFEELTGLKKSEILNRRFMRDISSNKEYAQKWVTLYEKVVSDNKTVAFEEHAPEFNRHYSVKAFPCEKHRFATIFDDISFEKKLQEISGYLIGNLGSHIDYDRITKFAQDVSGAEYAAFNLFDEDGLTFSTVSLCGMPENINKALALLHFDVVGKTWPHDPVREQILKGTDITHFDALHHLTGNRIPKTIIVALEKVFGLGETVVAKIRKEDKVLGDFTLFFKKENRLKNRDLLLLYMSLLGLFLEKNSLNTALRANRKMFYTLAEYAPVGFLSCSTKGEILYANKKILEILNVPSFEAAKTINLLAFPKLKAGGFSDKLKECMEKEKTIVFEMDCAGLWGKLCWLKIHLTPNKQGDAMAGANIVINDITDSKKTEDYLKELAQRDSLTKAYNRNALNSVIKDRLRESLCSGLIGCFAVVDVDDFKSINDTYGHKAGDSVLQNLSADISQILGDYDLLVRTGGDEFLVYLHDVKDEQGAASSIKALFDKVSAVYTIKNDDASLPLRLQVNCSIGASLSPKDGKTVETLMAKADKALYAVKNSEKAGFRFTGD